MHRWVHCTATEGAAGNIQKFALSPARMPAGGRRAAPPARASAPIYGLKVCGPAKVQQMRQRERFIVDVDAFRSCGS